MIGATFIEVIISEVFICNVCNLYCFYYHYIFDFCIYKIFSL